MPPMITLRWEQNIYHPGFSWGHLGLKFYKLLALSTHKQYKTDQFCKTTRFKVYSQVFCSYYFHFHCHNLSSILTKNHTTDSYHQRGYVSTVHLSICHSQQNYSKPTEPISMTFCVGVGHDLRKNPLHFAADPNKQTGPFSLSLTWCVMAESLSAWVLEKEDRLCCNKHYSIWHKSIKGVKSGCAYNRKTFFFHFSIVLTISVWEYDISGLSFHTILHKDRTKQSVPGWHLQISNIHGSQVNPDQHSGLCIKLNSSSFVDIVNWKMSLQGVISQLPFLPCTCANEKWWIWCFCLIGNE